MRLSGICVTLGFVYRRDVTFKYVKHGGTDLLCVTLRYDQRGGMTNTGSRATARYERHWVAAALRAMPPDEKYGAPVE
eukprot:351272-Chlamydomonas_euryale.AAC.1